MHARRAVLPIVLIVVTMVLYVWQPPQPVLLDDDVPAGTERVAVGRVPESIDELRARIAKIIARDDIPGVSIALVDRNGPIWVGGVGVSDLTTHMAMDENTVFRVGSLSKGIVVLGIMRLVDQGRLDLDRPLRELMPDAGIDNPWEDVAPVTLAQCLEHTAGFDEMRFNELFTDDEELSVPDALALNPRSRRVRWRPGSIPSYSNVGYALAGRAIEVATGEPFDTYLRREIMVPLGMPDADFRRTPTLSAHLATGYIDHDRAALYKPLAHRPAGSLLASANDLAKVVHFWLRRGEGSAQLVSGAGLARIERSATLPFPPIDEDYGLANYGDVSQPVLGRGHDGGMPGFHASMRYFPSLGVGYVLLLNSTKTFDAYRQLRALLFAYLTRGRALPPPPPARPADPPGAEYFAVQNPHAELSGFVDRALVGWHVTETPRGVHVASLLGPSFNLVPAHDGAFRIPGQSGSSFRFTTNRDGVPVLIARHGYFEAAPLWLAQIRVVAFVLAMKLLILAPLWAAFVLGLAALRRRSALPLSLVLWPAIAALSWNAVPHVFFETINYAVVGIVHPLTIALCGLTLLFGVSSAAALIATVRWQLRPDRPRLASRLFPTACTLAACGLALWLGAHGIIGLRTWAW